MVRSELFDLPNELLLDVFQYLDLDQLFYSFYGLTIRTDTLLKHYHQYHWRLDTTENFNLVCGCLELKQIRSLSISNSDQIVLFNQILQIPQFVRNCQALIIGDITPYDFIYSIPCLSEFKNLSSLSVIRKTDISYGHIYNKLFYMIIDNQMPMLKHLKLIVPHRQSFIPRSQETTVTFTTNKFEHLVLKDSTIAELYSMFPLLPSLNSISIHALRKGISPNNLSTKTKITKLKLQMNHHSSVNFNDLTLLFIQMPQLKIFSLKAHGTDFADGHKWKDTIEKYFPSLLKFRFECRIHQSVDINEIVSTFQTDFWLKIKKWPVKYVYEKDGKQLITKIYTIS